MPEGAAADRAAKRQRLAQRRKALGLTQEALARILNVERTTVARWERGETEPLPWLRPKLAKALRVSADRLEDLLDGGGAASADHGSTGPARPDPAHPVPADSVPAKPVRPDAPHHLPAAVADFTGRAPELGKLTRILDNAGPDAPGTVVISAIGGTAGVGKTALAVQWARQVAGRFPDGQLYVNLRGFDPDEPVAAADALAGLLRSLGVRGAEIPDGAEDRARLYRSTLAGRRVLVLLDNARDGEQVRPLLPGDPGCVAVVTSRDAMAGLVAREGARRVDLDVLPLADAVALLRSLVGPRADEHPDATAELARLCARLPLALRIAAELAAGRPQTPLPELVAELEAARLDLLDAGEDRADIRAVFSWSFRQLPEDVAGAFALLGLHPGEDLDVHAVAALTGTTVGQARRVLGRLHRASLVQAAGPDRYSLHDLLRAYAREQALATEPGGGGAAEPGGRCQQALTRLFDYYLAAAVVAMDVQYPAGARPRPLVPPSAAAVPAMSDNAEARAWLDRELANLVAVVVHGTGHGWPRHATALAGTLFRYLMIASHLPEAETIYTHALQAARRSGDLAAEADSLSGLGGIGLVKGSRDAAEHCQAALECYRACGERGGEARVLRNLGVIEQRLHNYQPAIGYFLQANAAYEAVGDRLGMAVALFSLSLVETEMGSLDQAAEHLRRALQVFREEKDYVREAEALQGMGDLSLSRGQLTEAADFHEQALAIYRRIDNPTGIAAGLLNLGEVSVHQGEYQQATSYLMQARTLFRQTGDQNGETMTLLRLAEALHAAGRPAAARAELAAALGLAAETGNSYQQASTHRDLAESLHSAGEDAQARHHWQQALDLYTQIGAAEADQVRSRLGVREAAAPQ
jgi:tetratricopeptide (TPR) repeat protein/transcriptional regulator with XRE-family HTH domain